MIYDSVKSLHFMVILYSKLSLYYTFRRLNDSPSIVNVCLSSLFMNREYRGDGLYWLTSTVNLTLL